MRSHARSWSRAFVDGEAVGLGREFLNLLRVRSTLLCFLVALCSSFAFASVARAQPASKSPVPDAAARELKRRQIDELFPIAAAKTRAEKTALVEKLMKAASESEGDAAAQFTLWNTVRELAAQSGRVRQAYAAVDAIAANFDVDAAALRLTTLKEALDSPLPPAEKGEVLLAGVDTVDQWLAADRYAEASKLSGLLLQLARRVRDPQALKAVIERRQVSDDLLAAFKRSEAAMKTLRDDPDNPAANATAGKFLALEKGDWRRGLAMLAKGSDAELAAAARLDLARPAAASEQVKIADAWWKAAQPLPKDQQAALLARSAAWYQRALPATSGLDRARAQTRVKELATAGVQPALLAGDTVDTRRLGGDGGGPFREVRDDRAMIVGFHMNYRVGCVKYLQARYLTKDGVVDGEWHGHPGGGENGQSVLAKDGYAVGGIVAKSGNRIDGFRVIFMRIDGDRLDRNDWYSSDWFGGRGGGGEIMLGGTGQPVIGLFGQQGADLDGAGLVLGVVDAAGPTLPPLAVP